MPSRFFFYFSATHMILRTTDSIARYGGINGVSKTRAPNKSRVPGG